MTPLPPGPFGCILADPPWLYRTFNGKRAVPSRTAADPYSTLSLEQLKALPVAASCARDCALFMWIVDSHLEQGLELGRSWGFTFRTKGFTWRKLAKDGQRVRVGMGKWTRKQTEQIYIFAKGKPPILSHAVREIIDAPVREHSRKPDEQYARIEALVGGPYLELFARTSRPGWTAWGDEADRFEVAA